MRILIKKVILGVTLILIMIMLMASLALAAPLFGPAVSYQTIENPWFVTTADVNNDGKEDLITRGENYVSVFLNNDGIFQTRFDYSVGSSPEERHYVVTGDFNNDGNIDLATLNRSEHSMIVLIGNGNGTYQQGIRYYVANDYWPRQIASGDFNGDGKIDVAVSNNYYQWGIISTFLGAGDGTFVLAANSWSEYNPLSSLVASDFNRDGYDDLAVASSFDSVSRIYILQANAGGSFNISAAYVTGPLGNLVSGDLDGDAINDLAAINWMTGTIHILKGNNDGTFQQRSEYISGSYGMHPTIGDYNADGIADIATSNYEGTISIFTGAGGGIFKAKVDYAAGSLPVFISSADFNGDGKIDLAVANKGDSSISIFQNLAPPLFAYAGPDQVIEFGGLSGNLVTLDGSPSYSAAGDPLTYTWTWDGGSADGISPTISLPLGTTIITLTVSDGNSTSTDEVNVTIEDTIPPVSVGIGGNDNWQNHDVNIVISASDSSTGVKEIHYNVDGQETVIYGDSTSFQITAEGVHNVSYFAIDNSGNIENSKSMTVKIDKTLPVLNIFANPATLLPTHQMVDVTIGGDALDTMAGVTSLVFNVEDEYGVVEPTLSGFNNTIMLEASKEGRDRNGRNYTITVYATDGAGNQSVASTIVTVK